MDPDATTDPVAALAVTPEAVPAIVPTTPAPITEVPDYEPDTSWSDADQLDAAKDHIKDLITELKSSRTLVAELEAAYESVKNAYDDLVPKYQKASKAVLSLQAYAGGLATGGATFWAAKTDKDTVYDLSRKSIVAFPTSPLPRASTGRHPVRVKPPPRFMLSNKKIVSSAPITEDYLVPENHLVFFVTKRNASKLNYGNIPQSMQQQRVAVVGDVVANWWNRRFLEVEEGGAHVNKQHQYDVTFAGVAYEGIDDPEMARKFPNEKGRFTVSMNGVVTVYCCTKQLKKDNIKLGQAVEWVPVGSGTSWRQLGPKFETPLIRKFDLHKHYERIKQNTTTAVPTKSGGFNPLDAVWTEKTAPSYATASHIPTTGLGGPHLVNPVGAASGPGDTVDIRVPVDDTGVPRHDWVAANGPPLSPAMKQLLKAIGWTKDKLENEPNSALFLALADRLKEVDAQVKPFGHELDGTEDATRAQQAYLIALSGMAQSGVLMGRKVKIDAGGQSVWYYDPAEHWIEIEDEFLKNGLNPQSIEYLYPSFQTAMAKLKTDDKDVYELLNNHGVLDDTSGKLQLNLTKFNADWGVDDEDKKMRAMYKLEAYAGKGPAKRIFAAAFSAIVKARRLGVAPSSSGSTAYTWDVIHELARKLTDCEKKERLLGLAEKTRDILDNLGTNPQKAKLTDGEKDILDELKKTVDGLGTTNDKLKTSVYKLLQKPLVGIKMPGKTSATITPEEVERAAKELDRASDAIHKLAAEVGVSTDNSNDIEDIIKKVINQYDAVCTDAQYESGDSHDMMGDRAIDLLVKEAEGRRLTPEESKKLTTTLAALKDKRYNISVVRAGIRKLVELSQNKDVQTWADVSRQFNMSIRGLDAALRNTMTAAVKRFYAASGVALTRNGVVTGYYNKIATENVEAAHVTPFSRMVPFAIKSEYHQPPSNDPVRQFAMYGAFALGYHGAMTLSDPSTHVLGQGDCAFDKLLNQTTLPFGNAVMEDLMIGTNKAIGRGMCLPPLKATQATVYANSNDNCQQLVTMITNTVAFATFATRLAVYEQDGEFSDLKGFFRFTKSADDAMKQPLRLVVIDPADNTAVANPVEKYRIDTSVLSGDNPFKKAIDNGNTVTTVNKETAFDIGVCDNFRYFGEWLRAHQSAGYMLSSVRLETDVGATTKADITAVYNKFKKTQADLFDNEYGMTFAGLGETERQELIAEFTKATHVGANELYALFGQFMPERDEIVEVRDGFRPNMSAPCYFHDHPFAAVLYTADAALQTDAVADVELDTGHFEAWACKNFNPRQKKQIDAAGPAIVLRSLRPNMSMSAYPRFLESIMAIAENAGKKPQAKENLVLILNNYCSGSVAKGLYKATSAPMYEETTLMDMAKRVLPEKEYRSRARAIGRHSKEMKKHLMGSLRATRSSHLATVALKETQGQWLSASEAEAKGYASAIRPGRDWLNAAGDAMENRDDELAVTKQRREVVNPFARRFGTLVKLGENMVRIMLNPALSNPSYV